LESRRERRVDYSVGAALTGGEEGTDFSDLEGFFLGIAAGATRTALRFARALNSGSVEIGEEEASRFSSINRYSGG